MIIGAVILVGMFATSYAMCGFAVYGVMHGEWTLLLFAAAYFVILLLGLFRNNVRKGTQWEPKKRTP